MYLDILCTTKNFKSLYKNLSVTNVDQHTFCKFVIYSVFVHYIYLWYEDIYIYIYIYIYEINHLGYVSHASSLINITPKSPVSKTEQLVSTPE